MSIRFTCPRCHETVRVADSMAGRKTNCPMCETVCRVPSSAVQTSAAGEPPDDDAAPLPLLSEDDDAPARPPARKGGEDPKSARLKTGDSARLKTGDSVRLKGGRRNAPGRNEAPADDEDTARKIKSRVAILVGLGVLALILGGAAVVKLLSPKPSPEGPLTTGGTGLPVTVPPIVTRPVPQADEFTTLRQNLKAEDASTRKQAVEKLTEMGPKAQPALVDLLPLLKDYNYDVSQAALGAFKKIGPPAKPDYPAVLAALKDESPKVRAGAARLLGEPGVALGADAVNDLAAALKDVDDNVRSAVVVVFGKLQPACRHVAMRALTADLRDDDPKTQKSVLEALARFDPPTEKDLPVFVAALKDPQPQVRTYAAQTLARMGPRAAEARDALLKAVKDDKPDVRRPAVTALAAIGRQPGVVAAVVEATSDPDADVRRQASEGLQAIGGLGKDDLPALRAALKSQQPDTRGFAATTLGKLGTAARDAVPDLAELLNDPALAVRAQAARALGAIGPDARAAVPALRDLVAEKIDAGSELTTPDTRPAMSGEALVQRLLQSTVWVNLPGQGLGNVGSGFVVEPHRRLVVTSYHGLEAPEQQGGGGLPGAGPMPNPTLQPRPIPGAAPRPPAGGAGGSPVKQVLVFFPEYKEKELITSPDYYLKNWQEMGPRGIAVKGDVVARDPERDLVLIQLASLPERVKALPLARQSAMPGQDLHWLGVSPRPANGKRVLWQYGHGQVKGVYKKEVNYPRQTVNAYVCEVETPGDSGMPGGPVINDRGDVVAVAAGGPSPCNDIDVREVTLFVKDYYKTLNKEWSGLTDGNHGDDPEGNLRRAAVEALAKIGPDSMPALRKLLENKNLEVRSRACDALLAMGPEATKPAVPELILSLREAEVRDRAAEVLAMIGAPAVPPLVEELKDRRASARLGAATALGRMGPAAKAAVVPLSRIVRDPNKDVREAVHDALGKIQK